MIKEDENLRDIQKDSVVKDSTSDLILSWQNYMKSYTKTEKLITALFMVTDFIDKDEPIRNKLRKLGVEIISDIHNSPTYIVNKVYEVMSLLDVARAINQISEMNYNILKREFTGFNQSIKEYTEKSASIENLLSESIKDKQKGKISIEYFGHHPIEHKTSSNKELRIGVQKASTLMKVISEKTNDLTDQNLSPRTNTSFDLLKKQRRNDIVYIIEDSIGGITIKDIRDLIKDKKVESLISCGEKTLQRELLSMVKDGVLIKTGEKRWSKYSLKSQDSN